MPKITPQNYPRIQDENSRLDGCLDDSQLVPHRSKLSVAQLKNLINRAIDNANQKSGRDMFLITPDMTPEQLDAVYEQAGKDLFAYFKKYADDPASTARQLYGKHYRVVAEEQFRNRMLQKGRMNSGWRYQYLAVDCARHSQRFRSVSDLGSIEADFNAIIDFIDQTRLPLSLYVSVKNRVNTLGGQDWPKAIQALEQLARNDKNRAGPYCCVFGIAMDKGQRYIKREKTGRAHSDNTEVWLSDYFWPFFANYSYEEIMLHVLEVLLVAEEAKKLPSQIDVPEKVLDAFGAACRKAKLVDEVGYFNDPRQLVHFFVAK